MQHLRKCQASRDRRPWTNFLLPRPVPSKVSLFHVPTIDRASQNATQIYCRLMPVQAWMFLQPAPQIICPSTAAAIVPPSDHLKCFALVMLVGWEWILPLFHSVLGVWMQSRNPFSYLIVDMLSMLWLRHSLSLDRNQRDSWPA